jgi:demethylmenaquinone methyltransferase / 2-methoxy-6-polyprenyl-1,4-benzoquinol methylase
MYSEARNSYDPTNHLLSFYTDSSIRKRAARLVMQLKPKNVLDMGTGTGDMAIFTAEEAIEAGQGIRIDAIDTNQDMLRVARAKAAGRGLKRVRFEVGDVLGTKYQDGCFDVVTCSFALKNFDSEKDFLKEVHRVLARNGTFVLTDISMPESPFGKLAFYVYYCYMKLFGLVTGKRLYKWLPESTRKFDRNGFIALVKRDGFSNVKVENHMFGIAYIMSCRKK